MKKLFFIKKSNRDIVGAYQSNGTIYAVHNLMDDKDYNIIVTRKTMFQSDLTWVSDDEFLAFTAKTGVSFTRYGKHRFICTHCRIIRESSLQFNEIRDTLPEYFI